MHHVLFAHGTAIDALRAEGVKNLGIVLNLEKSEPATTSAEDIAATDIGDAIFNRWYLDGVFKGKYPEALTGTTSSPSTCPRAAKRTWKSSPARSIGWASTTIPAASTNPRPTSSGFPISPGQGRRSKPPISAGKSTRRA